MSNEFVTVKREVVEQVVDAAFSTYCSQHLGKLVPALRAALEQPVQEHVAWVWNPAKESWEKVHVFGHWQQGAIYAFGPEAPQPAQQAGVESLPTKITEEMHVAACKVLTRAHGLAGTPQRMLDAMRAAAPQPAQQPEADKLLRQALEAMEVQGSEWVILERNAIAAIRKYLGES